MTVYTGDIGKTFAPKGLSIGSSLPRVHGRQVVQFRNSPAHDHFCLATPVARINLDRLDQRPQRHLGLAAIRLVHPDQSRAQIGDDLPVGLYGGRVEFDYAADVDRGKFIRKLFFPVLDLEQPGFHGPGRDPLGDGIDDVRDLAVEPGKLLCHGRVLALGGGDQSLALLLIGSEELGNGVGRQQALTDAVENAALKVADPDGAVVRAGARLLARGAAQPVLRLDRE